MARTVSGLKGVMHAINNSFDSQMYIVYEDFDGGTHGSSFRGNILIDVCACMYLDKSYLTQ